MKKVEGKQDLLMFITHEAVHSELSKYRLSYNKAYTIIIILFSLSPFLFTIFKKIETPMYINNSIYNIILFITLLMDILSLLGIYLYIFYSLLKILKPNRISYLPINNFKLYYYLKNNNNTLNEVYDAIIIKNTELFDSLLKINNKITYYHDRIVYSFKMIFLYLLIPFLINYSQKYLQSIFILIIILIIQVGPIFPYLKFLNNNFQEVK